MIQFFKTEGNYENKHKARVRYMVDEFGEEEFIKKLKSYVDKQKQNNNLKIIPEPIDYNKQGSEINFDNPRLFFQKQPGLYTVYIHPLGGIYKLKDLKCLLKELDKVRNPIIRLGMMEEMYILNLNAEEAKKILEITECISACTQLESSISCIGSEICQIGICNSQKMLSDIITYFKVKSENRENIKVMPRIYISGCKNSCAVHQIACIGLTGKLKKVNGKSVESFEMSINGKFSVGQSKLGEYIADFKQSDIPPMLYEISEKLIEKNIDFYTLTSNYKEEFNQIIDKYKI
ncbi:MAG: nitrite/sulfite reductase, partial [Intestinibacter bartlettii]|nr:nitrite/sulfite reductase [Intestinibacter bartlettii]